MKKVLMMLSVVGLMSITVSVQAESNVKSESNDQEVATCTNGFDSVNVCQLLS